MDTIKNFNKPQKSVVWHFQWVKKGSEPSLDIKPGEISGFEKYFQDAPKSLSSFFLAVSGTQRFETADWLHQQAVKQGFEQYVTEFQVLLNHSYKDRINGVNEEGQPINEYELIKATTALKQQLIGAWLQVVKSCEQLDIQSKNDLLTVADSNDINAFLPISAHLFSKAIEGMRAEFQEARAIIFPAIPLAHEDWHDKPVKMIAFKKETIVSIKPMWNISQKLAV